MGLARARVPAGRHARQRVRLPRAQTEHRRLDRHRGDRAVVRGRDRRADLAAGPRPRAPPARLLALQLRLDRRHRREDVDPRRPPVGVDDPDRHRHLDADPPVRDLLHGRRQGVRPLLRLPQLLRLLDAAPGPGRELPAADRGLGVRRRGLLPADLLLVSPQDRDGGGAQGVRHQRRRRRRPGARHLLHLQAHRHARNAGHVQRHRARRVRRARRRRPHGGVHPAAGRRVREVGADPAAHVAARRDGRTDAGQCPDPRGHDGHRGRLSDRAHAPAVRTRAGGAGRRRGDRLRDAADRRARSPSRRPTSSA